jgi:signal transduction histidine kinase
MFIRIKRGLEKQMSEASDMFSEAIQALPVGVAILDTENRVGFVNDKFAFMLNKEPTDLVTSHLPSLCQKATSPTRELETKNRNGEDRVLMLTSASLESDEGFSVGTLIVASDITERRKTEAELERVAHQIVCLRNVVSLFSDTERPIRDVLNTFVHLIIEGWQYPEITCAKIEFGETEVKSANYDDSEWKQIAEFTCGLSEKGILEVHYLEERAEVDEGPFLNEERNLVNTLAAEVERYIRRKLNEDLRRQQHRELDIYSRLLRHDLRNDLAVIIGNIEIARMVAQPLDDVLSETFTSSEAVCDRMMSLLKAFSRPAESIERNMVTILRNIVSKAEKAHSDMTIELIPNKGTEKLTIAGSRLLPLVFENLLRNAAMHAGESPTVEIKVSREGGNAKIVVIDNGPGVLKEIRDKLFQKGVSTRGGGHGLYLSRQVVESMGGFIDLIDSESGKGATFRVLLPLTI